MDIYVDSRPLPWASELPPVEAITRLLEDLDREQRVVASLVLDGHPLGMAWEEVYRRIGQGQARQLRVRTAPVHQLLWDTLQVLAVEMPALLEEIEATARHLQRGEDGQGFAMLSSLLEKVESYTQFLGALMRHEPEQVAAAERQVSQLTHWMAQVMGAWQREDLVLVADYLAYELAPLFRTGVAWLQELAQQKTPAAYAASRQANTADRRNGSRQEVRQ